MPGNFLAHVAAGEFFEGAGTGRTPGLVGGMPGDRTQARRARNPPRSQLDRADRARKTASLVAATIHVIFLGLLGEDGNLLLHQDMTGIVRRLPPVSTNSRFLDDLRTELGGRLR